MKLYEQLVCHAINGLLACQNADTRYVDEPGKKKEVKIAEDAIKIADEVQRQLKLKTKTKE